MSINLIKVPEGAMEKSQGRVCKEEPRGATGSQKMGWWQLWGRNGEGRDADLHVIGPYQYPETVSC